MRDIAAQVSGASDSDCGSCAKADCPFAYVLLVGERSPTAIEQIVGRILRLPGAQEKQHPDLNCAYAFSVSASITEVLAELRDALESNGFTPAEADRIIIPVPQGVLPLGVLPQTVPLASGREVDTAALNAQVALLAAVRYDATKGELTVIARMRKASGCACAQTLEARSGSPRRWKRSARRTRLWRHRCDAEPTPYERQLTSSCRCSPCAKAGAVGFEHLPVGTWKLSEKDAIARGDPRERPAVAWACSTRTSGRVTGHAVEQEATEICGDAAPAGVSAWHDTDDELAAWLDRQIEHRDVPRAKWWSFSGRRCAG